MTADLVVLTVLPEEYAAVLACLREPELIRGSTTIPNMCAWRLGMIAATHYRTPFKVVVGMGTPTTTFGALAASQAIELFDPRYVAFVGVAGGFDRDGQRHGDVAVSSVVTAYEYGKVDTGGFAPRGSFTYRCNEALVRATDAARATGARWWSDDDNLAGPPSVRTGMIASGDKVIDDPDEAFFAAVHAAWPKLLAVEMEGAGMAAAVHEVQGHRSVGFILVRGISDMPHRKAPGAPASTLERDGWKVTASRNAARFLAHLIATAWPVPPGDDTSGTSDPAAAGTGALTRAASESAAAACQVPSPTPAYPNPEVRALSERLRDAQARKQALRDAGFQTDEVDNEILQLRRQLREGGQLR
ncbi:MAG TPA: 5'-methylthioadenosine/S-adenosylhomocysteine nucleosidase, partial [Kofleriaceae bacterium]